MHTPPREGAAKKSFQHEAALSFGVRPAAFTIDRLPFIISPDMTQDELKQAVARAAISHVPIGAIVGVGTGSTANYFIDDVAKIKHKSDGAVASSEISAQRLRKHGVEVLDLNMVTDLPVYVDGAD